MNAWQVSERCCAASACAFHMQLSVSFKVIGRVQSTMSHPGTAGVCNYSLLARCKPEPGFHPVWMQSRMQEHPIALFCLRWVDKLQYEIAPAACVAAETSVRSEHVPGAPQLCTRASSAALSQGTPFSCWGAVLGPVCWWCSVSCL